MKTVYLCGGINKLSDSDAKDWRREATLALADHKTLDPMRRDYRGVEAQSVTSIVNGDLADIGESDIILVNAQRPSWGTAMEIYHAALHGKHVVAFGAGEHPSPWLVYYCDELHPTLADALGAIRG